MQVFQRKRFRREFERLTEVLGLADWDVRLVFVPAMDDKWAETSRNEQKNEATIEVGADTLSQPWRKQVGTIVHELLHLQARDLIIHVWRQLDRLDVSSQARSLVQDGLQRQEELLVDRLEHVITPLVS